MAVRVEAKKELVTLALNTQLASLKRALNTARNPAFKPILEKDIADLQTAIGSITEVK